MNSAAGAAAESADKAEYEAGLGEIRADDIALEVDADAGSESGVVNRANAAGAAGPPAPTPSPRSGLPSWLLQSQALLSRVQANIVRTQSGLHDLKVRCVRRIRRARCGAPQRPYACPPRHSAADSRRRLPPSLRGERSAVAGCRRAQGIGPRPAAVFRRPAAAPPQHAPLVGAAWGPRAPRRRRRLLLVAQRPSRLQHLDAGAVRPARRLLACPLRGQQPLLRLLGAGARSRLLPRRHRQVWPIRVRTTASISLAYAYTNALTRDSTGAAPAPPSAAAPACRACGTRSAASSRYWRACPCHPDLGASPALTWHPRAAQQPRGRTHPRHPGRAPRRRRAAAPARTAQVGPRIPPPSAVVMTLTRTHTRTHRPVAAT